MDGQTIALAFASQSGPDCIKDVVSKYGLRLKVYQIIKKETKKIGKPCVGNGSALLV